MIVHCLKKPILGATLLSVLLLANFVSAQDVIDDSRDALEELIETKRFTAEAQKDWAVEKQIIKDTIDTLQKQIESVEARLDDIVETTTDAQEERANLQGEIEELEEVLGIFEPMITNYERRLRELIPYFPEPLMNKINRLVDQLPNEGERANRRMLNNRAVIVVGLLDEINNFQNSVQVHNQLLKVDQGPEREFSVLYYGLAQAYFVDENETTAGIGKPAKGGWEFEVVPGTANDVFDAVQIKEKQLLARFVELPTDIQDIPSTSE